MARFAESHGYEQDYDRPYAYHYRDFLIKAFNGDMPYDQFVRWQLAGDELAPGDPLAMAATGFLGAGPFPTQLTEAEFESARYNELDDMVATTGIGVSRAHPSAAPDATITSTTRSPPTTIIGWRPCSRRPSAARSMSCSAAVLSRRRCRSRPRATRTPSTMPTTAASPTSTRRRISCAAATSPRRWARRRPACCRSCRPARTDLARWKVEPTTASRPAPRFHRAALAAWLTDTGVRSRAAGRARDRQPALAAPFRPGDRRHAQRLRRQGSRPSHPELLDWLAATLIENGWRLKPIHRLIVTSAVYMQDGRYDEARAAIDRENVFHWRHTPRRLEAEPIRDAMLAVAGRLDRRMYGPGSLDPAMPRRSVYFFIKRSQLVPMMMLFDWPEHLVSIGQRSTTTTAPQALVIPQQRPGPPLRRGSRRPGRVPAAIRPSSVALAYRIAFGREPTQAEARLAAEFLAAQRSAYARDGRPDPDRSALVDFCQALSGMNELIYIP